MRYYIQTIETTLEKHKNYTINIEVSNLRLKYNISSLTTTETRKNLKNYSFYFTN